MEYAIVVLAAGYSHRFGSDKRLANIKGEPMLVQTVQHALAAAESIPETRVQVVLRARDPIISPLFAHLPVQLVHAPVWPVGISASLVAAVERFRRQGANPRAVLVCLGDMPFVEPQTLQKLLENAAEDRILVPVCAGTRGYPIVIGRRYFSALARLRRATVEKVLRLYCDCVQDIEVADPAINCDINRPQDFHEAARQDLFGKTFAVPDTVPGALLASPSE
ncbi:nucleotidyltransferase family protein [Microbulbifer sp.]|uniref:nucleotidyltransferase family protein n=1 Tax=Microbulbifer sp. TaxID=1908541 RepID=UPI00258AA573|nr:nucleotidyltransferase family protein [Microbulbifer sp.]